MTSNAISNIGYTLKHGLKQYSIFKIIHNKSNDPKRPENIILHYSDVRGDFLRLPHNTAIAEEEIKIKF